MVNVSLGWGPVQRSSHTPEWDQWKHGWWSNDLDTYNPRHFLCQNPGHRYSQSPWKPKRTAIHQLLYPRELRHPAPYPRIAAQPVHGPSLGGGQRTPLEETRAGMGQETINWVTLGN